jgi:hypothetical protein
LRRTKDKEVSLKRNFFEWKDISKNDDNNTIGQLESLINILKRVMIELNHKHTKKPFQSKIETVFYEIDF